MYMILINEEQTLPRLLTVVPRLLRDWLSDWGLSGKRYFGQPPYIYIYIYDVYIYIYILCIYIYMCVYIYYVYTYIYIYILYIYILYMYIYIYIFPPRTYLFNYIYTHTSTNKSSQAWQVKSLVFLKSDKLTLVDPRFPGGLEPRFPGRLAKKIQEILDQYIQDPKFWVVGPRCMGKRIWRFLLIQQLRLAVVRLTWAVFRHAGVWPKAIV